MLLSIPDPAAYPSISPSAIPTKGDKPPPSIIFSSERETAVDDEAVEAEEKGEDEVPRRWERDGDDEDVDEHAPTS